MAVAAGWRRADLLALRLPSAGDPGEITGAGMEIAWGQWYAEHYFAKEPWRLPMRRLPEGALSLGRNLIRHSELVRTEFYRDWMRPQGFRASPVLLGVLRKEGDRPRSTLSIFQRDGARALDAGEVAAIRAIVPHLQRAVRLDAEAARVHEKRDAVAAALGLLPAAVVLVGEDARIISANATGERLLASATCLRRIDGHLFGCDSAESAALRRDIAEIAAGSTDAAPDGAEGTAVTACRVCKAGTSIAVLPLPPGADSSPKRSTVAAVVVSNPGRWPGPDEDVLRRLYGLTAAEARLARRVSRGESVETAAAALGIAINTVRTQLRQVFAKTKTKRQADLVRVLLTATPPSRIACPRVTPDRPPGGGHSSARR